MPPDPASAAVRSRAWRRNALAVALAAVVVLAGCTGERPTLGKAPPTTATTSTTVAATTTTVAGAPAPASLAPGPDTMLGYIATPTGDPLVYEGPDTTYPQVKIGTTTSAGAPTTFAVVGDPTTAGEAWIQVLLPTRPNGAIGWVPALSVGITRTPLRILIDLAGRTLKVQDSGNEVLSASVAIGTTENPTPVGPTYVTELIQNVNPGGAYGPYAFGLAMHSDTLTEFNGGPGQVGIHGTNQPELIGQAVSHGCVRLNNDDIKKLLDLQLPLGVPVFVT